MNSSSQSLRILILGANGMLGHMLFEVLSSVRDWHVVGTVRSSKAKKMLQSILPAYADKVIAGVDVTDLTALEDALDLAKPDVVINCVGLIKQDQSANDPIAAITINALLPHRLEQWCAKHAVRLIHISTDCVFSGQKGAYTEEDICDAQDWYGKSKYLGELSSPNSMTIRTSIIGPELPSQASHGLLAWFMAQTGSCPGYSRAVFSGLPTVILAEILRDVVIPNTKLNGLYQVSAQPITKLDLLQMVANTFDMDIAIVPSANPILDRSLNGARFEKATGYHTPDWPELISRMHTHWTCYVQK